MVDQKRDGEGGKYNIDQVMISKFKLDIAKRYGVGPYKGQKQDQSGSSNSGDSSSSSKKKKKKKEEEEEAANTMDVDVDDDDGDSDSDSDSDADLFGCKEKDGTEEDVLNESDIIVAISEMPDLAMLPNL